MSNIYLGDELDYGIDDLMKGIDTEAKQRHYLEEISELLQREGSYEALFCDYGLEVSSKKYPRLAKLVKLFTSTKHELDCLFTNME